MVLCRPTSAAAKVGGGAGVCVGGGGRGGRVGGRWKGEVSGDSA